MGRTGKNDCQREMGLRLLLSRREQPAFLKKALSGSEQRDVDGTVEKIMTTDYVRERLKGMAASDGN